MTPSCPAAPSRLQTIRPKWTTTPGNSFKMPVRKPTDNARLSEPLLTGSGKWTERDILPSFQRKPFTFLAKHPPPLSAKTSSPSAPPRQQTTIVMTWKKPSNRYSNIVLLFVMRPFTSLHKMRKRPSGISVPSPYLISIRAVSLDSGAAPVPWPMMTVYPSPARRHPPVKAKKTITRKNM